MKLVRYGPAGAEKPGLIDAGGTLRDLGAHVGDVDGGALSPASVAELRALDVGSLPAVEGEQRLGPCVNPRAIGKFVCVGLNYTDHAKELGSVLPEKPMTFFKATSCIVGPNDDIVIPRGSECTDWEVELGIVVGKEGKYIAEEDAMDFVAGFWCVDFLVSFRDGAAVDPTIPPATNLTAPDRRRRRSRTASSTTSASARIRRRAARPRRRAATPSARWDRGWSPRTRSATRRA